MRMSRFGLDPYNWIVEERLIASAYPTDLTYITHLRDIEGVNTFINLTESAWPLDWLELEGIEYHHFPIKDMSVPSRDLSRKILDVMGSSKGPVMVHCAAGIGRTGTLIALYLVENGMGPDEAIDLVRDRRFGSIQTKEQENIVKNWRR